MKVMKDFTYYTKPVTLSDHIHMQKIIVENDFLSIAALIISRTSLTETETMQLDDYEVAEILTQVTMGITASIALQKLGQQL